MTDDETLSAGPAARVIFVVSLWLSGNDVAGFEAFERAAAGIMGAYGGRIESVVRCGGTGESPFEIHVVSFPDLAARDAYRRDPALLALGWLRQRVIARTEILQGVSRPSYGPLVNEGVDAPGASIGSGRHERSTG